MTTSTQSISLSTALPFVDARPHLGLAYEAVLADAIARHARARGRAVRFVSGTDEHSPKTVLAAERAGVPVADFVRAHAERFASLRDALDLSTDVFVRTSEPRHGAAVARLWSALAASAISSARPTAVPTAPGASASPTRARSAATRTPRSRSSRSRRRTATSARSLPPRRGARRDRRLVQHANPTPIAEHPIDR